MSDTDLVPFEALNPAQLSIINQATPKEVIRHRQGRGGKQFAYVDHLYVTVNLNLAFGHQWSWEIENVWFIPNIEDCKEVAVQGKLTVHSINGTPIIKQQFGGSDAKKDKQGNYLSLADDLKSASSDALKKAASLVGLAIDVYGSDYDSTTGTLPVEPTTTQTGEVVYPTWMPDAVQYGLKVFYGDLSQEDKEPLYPKVESFFKRWYVPSNESEATQKNKWVAYLKDTATEQEFHGS